VLRVMIGRALRQEEARMWQWLERAKALRESLNAIVQHDIVRQVSAAMKSDLPALLVDALQLAPADLSEVRAALDRELAHVIQVCGEEEKVLGSRQARIPLVVEMSLARVSSASALLQAIARSNAAVLVRTDPRLLALTHVGDPLPQQPESPHRHLSRSDCRVVAEQLRRTLRDVACAAIRIQSALHGQQAPSPSAIAGALAQMATLATWWRAAQARCGATDARAARAS